MTLRAAATEDGASLTADDPTAVKAFGCGYLEANDSGATAKVNVNDGVVTVIVTAARRQDHRRPTSVKLVKEDCTGRVHRHFRRRCVAEGKLALETGKSVKLTATVTPTDADDAAVSWSVEGDAVTVDKTGLVKAVKAGTRNSNRDRRRQDRFHHRDCYRPGRSSGTFRWFRRHHR
ncbi:MAG: Ig domain-containing protein [Bifidobacterium bifidum]